MKYIAILGLIAGIMGFTGGKKINLGESNDLNNWFVTNDGVMGGLSDGRIDENKKSLIFQGELSLENNGGFTRIQRRMDETDYSAYKGLRVRMRGDGRTYGFTLESHSRGRGALYRQDFVAVEEWKEYFFSFEDFEGRYFGQPIGRNFSEKNNLQRIGLILSDKKPGSFELEIDWIDFE